MNNKTSKLLILTGILIFAAMNLAGEKSVDIGDFTGISTGTGIEMDVRCGSENKVTLEADEKVLAHIEVSVENNILDITRKKNLRDLLHNFSATEGSIHADVVTANPINMIDASTGAIITLAPCTVDADQLTVDTSTGALVQVDGTTRKLVLDMSTGSSFNHKNDGLEAEMVSVDMSTGSVAHICRAKNIEGDMTTGAHIYVSSNANRTDLDKHLGAGISSRKCK